MSLNKIISSAFLGLLVCTPIVAIPSAAFSRELSSVERSHNEQASIVQEIDVFGTEQIIAEHIRQALGDEITQFAEAIYDEHQNTDSDLEELYQKIIDSIQAMGDFAYVDISPVMYFEEQGCFMLGEGKLYQVDWQVLSWLEESFDTKAFWPG